MLEHYTEGIVLSQRARGEQDATIVLFTKELGKIPVFAKSIRKMTSKLSGHLQPGTLVGARIIEKNQMQIVDAIGIRSKCNQADIMPFLQFLDAVLPAGVCDAGVWRIASRIVNACEFGIDAYSSILNETGFGGIAECGMCGNAEIAYFSAADIMLVCNTCGEKFSKNSNDLLHIG